MPSRFTGLAAHVERPARIAEWDAYDDMPADPAYISLAKRDAIRRRSLAA